MEKYIPASFAQRFENDLRELYSVEIQKNRDFGNELWSALTNVGWMHNDDPEQKSHGYSFRSAGGFVASMLADSDYMEWYCSSPEGVVSDRIANDLAQMGWKSYYK